MKKTFAILTLTLALAMTAQAQIFIEEGDMNQNRAPIEDLGVIPIHGTNIDQANYVPLGGGIMFLSSLGGLYLLKRKKQSK